MYLQQLKPLIYLDITFFLSFPPKGVEPEWCDTCGSQPNPLIKKLTNASTAVTILYLFYLYLFYITFSCLFIPRESNHALV